MEFVGDNPKPRPPAAPEAPVGLELRVTPENVVILATLFRECADRLAVELAHIQRSLSFTEPWMSDPVSQWALRKFSEHFMAGDRSLVKVMQDEYDQYSNMTQALVAAGRQYGLTDDLFAAGFTDIEAAG